MATALVSITPECSICCENLKTPKVLTCGHTFCYECIDRYIGDKKETFPCPICQQDIKIPEGGANMFITCFILQKSPNTTQVTGTPTWPQISEKTDQPVTTPTPTHHCPNHSKKEVEYYCQTCNLGLCSKCILKEHMDHKKLDLECDSTRKMIAKELSKSEQFLNNKIEDLETTHVTLLETSEKLKSFCDKACTKINEKTEKIIGELKENCEKIKKQIRDNFDKNESHLTETRQKVMTQIKTIKTDLDTSRPTTEEPSLTLINSLNKLQDLQKLCENMKTDIPLVTYVEWREGSVKVCDILGSTVTKPLNQPRDDGDGPDGPDTHDKWPTPEITEHTEYGVFTRYRRESPEITEHTKNGDTRYRRKSPEIAEHTKNGDTRYRRKSPVIAEHTKNGDTRYKRGSPEIAEHTKNGDTRYKRGSAEIPQYTEYGDTSYMWESPSPDSDGDAREIPEYTEQPNTDDMWQSRRVQKELERKSQRPVKKKKKKLGNKKSYKQTD